MPRYVFLNSLPLSAFSFRKPFRLVITPVRPEVLKSLAPLINRHPVTSYIRHESTIQLLNKLYGLQLTTGSGLYQYTEGDILYVVTLKRPIRGAEVKNLGPEDIQIYQVEVFPSE